MPQSATTKALQFAVKPNRVLFARIGRMTYYAGPQAGDERPERGGFYNADPSQIGHEAFNFADFGNGLLYGFIRPANIRKIDSMLPRGCKQVDGVLVVFIAWQEGGQRVVGWYRNATVYAEEQPYPKDVKKAITQRLLKVRINQSSFGGYRVEAERADATLLPTHQRLTTGPIPGGGSPGGFGESNLRYFSSKTHAWMKDVVQFVKNYDKENLMDGFAAEAVSELSMAMIQERAAGFQSDPAIRRKIEDFAMKRARATLATMGYVDFENTSKFASYDYTCRSNSQPFFVEVKGTQTSGESIILTRKEVEHIDSHPYNSILVVVRGVTLDAKKRKVSGGIVVVREHWKLLPKDLTPTHFIWKAN